jgi:CHAT domain-containing protein
MKLMEAFYKLRAAAPTQSKAETFKQAQLALLCGTPQVAGSSCQTGPADTSDHAREADNNENDDAPLFTPNPAAPYAHPYFWAPFILIGNSR